MGIALVWLSCRSGLIPLRREFALRQEGNVYRFHQSKAALGEEGHVCDPNRAYESWKPYMTLLTEGRILSNR